MAYKDKQMALANHRKSYRKLMKNAEWRERRRSKAAIYMRIWYAKLPAERKTEMAKRGNAYKTANREWTAFQGRLRNYGLTLDEFHSRYEAQNFCCAICKSEMDVSSAYIDHHHASGKVRGLLCQGCNWGIGMLGESRSAIRSAIGYLEKWGTHVD